MSTAGELADRLGIGAGERLARDLYAAVAASGRGDREGARTALEAMRARPGWSTWLAAMTGDARLSAVSRLLE